MTKDRIEYLDSIKGIAIFLVVFCHNVFMPQDTIVGNVLMTIAWGAVPCFFMVSGGVMHARPKLDWKKYFKRLIETYVVLCIWKIIYLLYFSFAGEVDISKSVLMKYILIFGSIEGINTGHMWFMYAYLAVLLFYPVSHCLLWSENNGKRVLLFAEGILFFFGLFLNSLDMVREIVSKYMEINLPELSALKGIDPFGSYQNMLFYFMLGIFLLYYRKEIREFLMSKRYRKCIPWGHLLVDLQGCFL